MEIIKVILNQNYFQYSDKYFQLPQSIAMGSPISSTLAEICLQFFEELTVKRWMETGEITYYGRYVDDIIIISDQKKSTVHVLKFKKNTNMLIM